MFCLFKKGDFALFRQAYIFGVELKNVLVTPIGDNALRAAINAAKTKLDEEIKVIMDFTNWQIKNQSCYNIFTGS